MRASKLLQTQETLLREGLESLENMSQTQRVDLGFALQSFLTSTKKALDQVKNSLRVDATHEAGAPNPLYVEGDLGYATISAPEPIIRMVKGYDIEALRKALGDDFEEFFEVQVVLTPRKLAFKNQYLALPPATQDFVSQCVEHDVGVGGISFGQRKKK